MKTEIEVERKHYFLGAWCPACDCEKCIFYGMECGFDDEFDENVLDAAIRDIRKWAEENPDIRMLADSPRTYEEYLIEHPRERSN